MHVVTTQYKGVFSGELDSYDEANRVARLKNARMCVYWDTATRGVLGLAADGPGDNCRVTKAVPLVRLEGVTAVIECSAPAVERWGAEPWG